MKIAIQRWGGLASFVMGAVYIIPSLIYLMGDLRAAYGLLSYDLADFLYGPVWAVSLITVVMALRERIADRAQRRMSLALITAVVTAGVMVAVALIRSANRHYHLSHPELNLEMSTQVLVVWTTILAGVTAAAWHFLGWTMLLIGSSGWTTRHLPRGLSLFYIVVGIASFCVYLLPENESPAIPLAVFLSI